MNIENQDNSYQESKCKDVKVSYLRDGKLSLQTVGFKLDENGKVIGVNGNKFARYLRSKFTLCYTEEGRFYVYDDGYFRYVEEIRLSQWFRNEVHKFASDVWSVSMEAQYMAALKREALAEKPMDNNRNFLNLKDGMLNLDTLELLPHDPKYGSTIRIPIKFDSGAKCPRFIRFLREIFDNDKERIRVVRQMMGYILTSSTKAQKAFIFYGAGSNGKSVLAEIIHELCGTGNVSAVSLNELSKSFARLDLMDKCLNLVTEAEVDGKSFNTEFFKTLVSGEAIRAEIKCGPSFTFTPFVKLIFAMNNLPYSRDRSYGLSRRLLIIPFDRQFRGDEIDPDLSDKLKEELPGILQFALKGLTSLRKNGYRFHKSKSIDRVLEEYKEIINPFSSFVDEMLEVGVLTDRVYNDHLVRAFKSWCAKSGHKRMLEMSNSSFHSQLKMTLKEKNILYKVSEGGKRYLGGLRFKIDSDIEEVEMNEL